MALQNPDFLVTQVDIKISQYRKRGEKCTDFSSPCKIVAQGSSECTHLTLPSQSHRLQLDSVGKAALEVSEGITGEKPFFSF